VKEIQLTQGKIAIIDDNDYSLISQYKWRYSKTGCGITSFRVNKIKRTVKMHRLILKLTDPKIQVDHINHNKLDNRRTNLRICTAKENSRNRRPYGKSKYLGVCFSHDARKKNPYTYIIARILVNNKRIFLGSFKTEEAAALAYDEAAKIHFGEFANLNFCL
jgi:hypothetical protein